MSGENAGIWASLSGVYGPGRVYQFEEYADRPSQGISADSDETYGRTVAMKAWVGDFTLQGTYTGREKEQPNGAFGINLGDHRSSANDYRAFLEARYVGGSESTQVDARLSIDHYSNLWLGPYGPDIFVDDLDATWFNASAQLNQKFGTVATLTAGAQLRQAYDVSLETYSIPTPRSDPAYLDLDADVPSQIYTGYAVVDVHPGDLVRLNAGVRLDQYQFAESEQALADSFTAVNPRGAIILSPGREVIKLVAGRAFRAPSEYERTYSDGGISSIPAVELRPENNWTGEMEWDPPVLRRRDHRGERVLQRNQLAHRPADGARRRPRAVRQHGRHPPHRGCRGRGASLVALGVDVRGPGVGPANPHRRSARRRRDQQQPRGPWARSSAPCRWGRRSPWRPRSGPSPRASPKRVASPTAPCRGTITLTGQIDQPNLEFGIGVRNLLDWPIYHPGGADLTIDALPQPGRNFFGSLRVQF